MAYRPIGSPARYADNTVNGYLPCTGIRLGFFNSDAFVSWVLNELLPHLRPFPEPQSMVCLDNLNVYLDPRVQLALEERGCLIRFLPPYSPDFNPIELTFSMLKAWIRRHFQSFHQLFQGDFGGFLHFVIAQSGCDRKAREHFQHAAGGYKFEGDYEAFQEELDR
jgi:transposase